VSIIQLLFVSASFSAKKMFFPLGAPAALPLLVKEAAFCL
jgi:hypothetical protein